MDSKCRNCPFMQSNLNKNTSGGGFMQRAGRMLKRAVFAAGLLAAIAFVIADWKHLSMAGEIFHDHDLGGGFTEPGYSYVARTWVEEHNTRSELRQKIENSDVVRFILPSGEVYQGPFDSAILLWNGKLRIRNGGAVFIVDADDAAFFHGGGTA